MLILKSVDDLLEHIKDVQTSVKSLSSDSLMNMSAFMEKNRLEVDDEIAIAFQYQDIITQQLDASIEAIDSMRSSIEIFSHAFKNSKPFITGILRSVIIKSGVIPALISAKATVASVYCFTSIGILFVTILVEAKAVSLSSTKITKGILFLLLFLIY